MDEIYVKLADLEKVTGKTFGDPSNPLLVSVRSGAVFSMPGMMDTILNLGLNDETVIGMVRLTENERFAYDSYRRFIQMYGDVVLDVHKSKFDGIFEAKKHEKNVEFDVELQAEDLKETLEEKAEVLKDKVEDLKEKAEAKAEDLKGKAEELKDKAEAKIDEVKDKAEDLKDQAEESVEEVKDQTEAKVEEVKEEAEGQPKE